MIGNCQAGWAVMILASLRPELFGPIIIAGSPLSYWAGVEDHPVVRDGIAGLVGVQPDMTRRRRVRRNVGKRSSSSARIARM